MTHAHADDGHVGRIMLLQGQPGSGKTHLMRAFRTQVHRQGLAVFGYMQMTSSSRRYDRYVLQKLVESLEQPHDADEGPASTLQWLSDALAARCSADQVAALRGATDGPQRWPTSSRISWWTSFRPRTGWTSTCAGPCCCCRWIDPA